MMLPIETVKELRLSRSHPFRVSARLRIIALQRLVILKIPNYGTTHLKSVNTHLTQTSVQQDMNTIFLGCHLQMYQEIHISSRYTKHTNYFSYNLFFRLPKIFLNIQSYVKNCYSRFSYVLSNNTGTTQWSRRQLVPRYCANIFTQNLINKRTYVEKLQNSIPYDFEDNMYRKKISHVWS